MKSSMSAVRLALCILSLHGLPQAFAARLQRPPHWRYSGPTLFPALAPGHDVTDLNHIVPNATKGLYYAQEGHNTHQAGSNHAMVQTEFNEDTVVLEHSNRIANVTCNADDMEVCFKSEDAYNLAKSTWNQNKTNLIVATYHYACGNTHEGTRSFFQANSSTFNDTSRCASLSTTQLAHEEAMKEVQIDLGIYQPSDDTSEAGTGQLRRRDMAPRQSSNLVDLSQDISAQNKFFNIEVIPGDEITGPDANQPITPDGQLLGKRLEKRWWPANWITAAATWVADKIQKVFTWGAEQAEALFNKIKSGAVAVGNFINEGFHHEFTPSYNNKWPFSLGSLDTTAQTVSRPSTALFGLGEGLELGSQGGELSIQCIGCGAKGGLGVDLSIGFSIADGVKSGHVKMISDPLTIGLQFGIWARGVVTQSFEKQIFSAPLSPLGVPNIIVLGPEISMSAALDLSLDAQVQILVGGILNVDAGSFTYDMVNGGNNGFSGFSPAFTPVAKANGSVTATVDLGLPIKLEFGIDIFNGKLKQTAALVEHPSVFGSVTLASNTDCQGLNFNVGLKNRIYIGFPSSIKNWGSYELRTDQLTYPLGCVSLQGYGDAQPGSLSGNEPDTFTCPSGRICLPGNQKRRRSIGNTDPLPGVPYLERRQDEPAIDPFEAVNETFPDGTADQTWVQGEELEIPGNVGNDTDKTYRVLVTTEDEGIVIAGTDGFVYLANNTDLENSAPFGTANQSTTDDTESGGVPTDNVLIFDLFERLLNYDPAQLNLTGITLIRATDGTQMPDDVASIAFVETKTASDGQPLYVAQPAYYETPIALVAVNIAGQDTKIIGVDIDKSIFGFEVQLPMDALKLGLFDAYIGGEVTDAGPIAVTSEDYSWGLLV